MKGKCEHCGREHIYLYRVPIATPEGQPYVEYWCKECLETEAPEVYDVS